MEMSYSLLQENKMKELEDKFYMDAVKLLWIVRNYDDISKSVTLKVHRKKPMNKK